MEENTKPEKTFYQDSTVTVTQSRYIAGSKTYAMRNISLVSIFRIVESRTGPALIAIVGLLLIFFSDDLKIVGGIAALLGVLWYISIKDTFSVRISTNAGEANSLISKNEDYIQTIVNALNDAIIYRG